MSIFLAGPENGLASWEHAQIFGRIPVNISAQIINIKLFISNVY